MKVNRHKIAEEYNTTVDWLKDYINSRSSKREKFFTIESKMADMKSPQAVPHLPTVDAGFLKRLRKQQAS